MDSFHFLPYALDALVKDLLCKKTKKDLKILSQSNIIYNGSRVNKKRIDLCLRKGVVPYEKCINNSYMTTTTALPPKKDFYSSLNACGISNSDYEHAKKFWNAFDCKTMAEYVTYYCHIGPFVL